MSIHNLIIYYTKHFIDQCINTYFPVSIAMYIEMLYIDASQYSPNSNTIHIWYIEVIGLSQICSKLPKMLFRNFTYYALHASHYAFIMLQYEQH